LHDLAVVLHVVFTQVHIEVLIVNIVDIHWRKLCGLADPPVRSLGYLTNDLLKVFMDLTLIFDTLLQLMIQHLDHHGYGSSPVRELKGV
jgi:hypothetical protein